MKPLKLFSLAIALFLMTACGEEIQEPEESQPIVFEHNLNLALFGNADKANQDCPADLPGKAGGQCGLYEVPLNWEHENDGFVEVFLRQYSKPLTETDSEVKGQLWLIDGGPGSSGLTFAQSAFVDRIHAMGWDLFIPTHRGVGFSTELRCEQGIYPLTQEVVKPCGEELFERYGENLNWFSSLGAAFDVNYLIDVNNPQNLPVVMVGASYGGFLTQRFIQLFESQLTAAVLISGINLDPKLENLAMHENETFRRLLAHCEMQADCSEMFDSTAVESAEALILGGEWQNCDVSANNQDLIPELLRGISMHPTLRVHIPLTIKQFIRCKDEDKSALNALLGEFREFLQTSSARPVQFNGIVNTHQIIIELLSSEKAIADPLIWPEDLLLGRSIEPILTIQSVWPSNSLPIDMPNRLDTDLPILVLHGGFDMQASKHLIEELNNDLTSDFQYSVMFPTAGHGTPVYTRDVNDANCSWDLMDSFLSAPRQALDLSCVSEVLGLTFLTEVLK